MKKLQSFFLIVFLLIFYIAVFSQEKKLDKNDVTYTYIEALRHKNMGNLPQAAYLFKKLTEVDSTCASCFYELAGIFYNGGDIKNGLPYAEEAYLLDKSNYWYVKNYADYLRYNEEWKKSSQIYSEAIKFKESNLEDSFHLAESFINSGRPKDGLALINTIENLYGFSEKFVFLKYKYYLQVKEYGKALSELEKLKNINPENKLFIGMQAEIYAMQKKNKEAIQSYENLTKEMPYFVNAYISWGKFYLSLNDTLSAFTKFNFVLSDSNFKKADKLTLMASFLKESDSKNYYSNYVENYYKKFVAEHDTVSAYKEFLCDFYETHNDFEKALQVCEQLISQSSTNLVYWDRYFYYLNVLRKYNEVLEKEKIVFTKLYNRPFVLFVSGLAAYFKENPVKSIQFLKLGLEASQNNKFLAKQMINLVAENYYKIKKPDSAFYYYELAISEGDDDIGMLNNYAYYLSLEDKTLDYALKMSKKTIDAEPKNATYLDTYAWILYKLKLYDQAYKYIKLAYKYDKRGSAEMVEHYGDILFCLGKKSKAIKFWRKSASMQNNDVRLLNKANSYVCP